MITTTEERVAETFQTRLDAPGDECAHARFPEVWNNSELSRELIDQAFGAVAGMYEAMGAMVAAGALSTDEGIGKVGEALDHALIVCAAFGYALGTAHALDALDETTPDDLSGLDAPGPEAA